MTGIERIHWAEDVGDDWEDVRDELTRAFEMSRAAASNGQGFVYVVHNDDLLGRRGAGPAMVATGLLSAARTAALEGSRKGWTANVVAYDEDVNIDLVRRHALWALDAEGITGELIRVGPGHLGKAVP